METPFPNTVFRVKRKILTSSMNTGESFHIGTPESSEAKLKSLSVSLNCNFEIFSTAQQQQ